jgi:DNA modification methylase
MDGDVLKLNKIYNEDCLETLKKMPDEFIDCCITSPPYWGLRDYGTGTWEGGDSDCNHFRDTKAGKNTITGHKKNPFVGDAIYKEVCNKCGALRIDKQVGLEKTPEEYTEKMVEIFREVRRALKKDGTLWLNLGDSYVGGGRGGLNQCGGGSFEASRYAKGQRIGLPTGTIPGLKKKDLVGIPWRVAFALQADGWYLRSDIIWSKPNPMPESVTDRPTKAHEYIFLMTKNDKYYYDLDAIREKHVTLNQTPRSTRKTGAESCFKRQDIGREFFGNPAGRNKRTVWTVTTKPFPGAHFATFPEDLIEPCILAGTSEKGNCNKCGVPWIRVLEKEKIERNESYKGKMEEMDENYGHKRIQKGVVAGREAGLPHDSPFPLSKTIGWQAQCNCDVESEPAIVYDPFMGAGTVAKVSLRAGRKFIGSEINGEYIKIADKRLKPYLGQRSLF